MIINKKIPKFAQYNLVIFFCKHKKYKNISTKDFQKKQFFDLNTVLDEKIISFTKNRYKSNILVGIVSKILIIGGAGFIG